jgi:ABC-type branched-subunit amino acid transport system permease subunit
VLSGAVGGFAAAMWMHVGGFPNVENLFGAGNGLERSITTITMVIIGGMGTIVGPIVGAMVFALADTIIGGLGVTVPVLGLEIADLNPLPTFLFAMLVLVYMPRGVVPETIDRGRRYLARRRGEEIPERGTGGRSATESVIEKYRDEIEEILGRDNK